VLVLIVVCSSRTQLSLVEHTEMSDRVASLERAHSKLRRATMQNWK
jgi:hypothetical protein